MVLKKRNTARGITLIELMVSLAVMGLLVSLIGTFLVGGMKFYRLSSAKGEIQRDVRQAIDLINRNLRQGQARTVTITRITGSQPPCSMIEFINVNGRQFRFYQEGAQLKMGTRNSSAASWVTNKIADNVRALLFTYPRTDNDSIVSVSLCFEKATYQGASKTLQLSVEKVRIMN